MKEVKHYKVKSIPSYAVPDAIFYVKSNTDTEVTTYITDLNGVPYLLKDDTAVGVETIINIDGTITVTGTTNVEIKLSPSLLNSINSALQSGDNISELINDSGYTSFGDLATVATTGDYTDLINTPTIPTQYTDEQAQDAVGTILIDTSTIDFSYNDVLNTISADVKSNSITANELSDNIDISEFTNDSGYLISSNLKTIEGQTIIGVGNIDLSKNDVGLSNVDDTSDLNKPVSTATQTALNLKEDKANKGIANGYVPTDASNLIPIGFLPPSAIERLVIVADQTARFALTTTIVQNGDTVKQTDTNVMYYVKDDTNLSNSNGYEIYRAGTAASVPWGGITSTPTTLTGYGITDAVPNNRLLNINGNSYDLSSNREWRVAQGDTGCLTFASPGITIASTTQVNTGAVTGYIVDNETNPAIPTYIYINYPGGTNITVTSIGGGQGSYILLGVGNTITFQNTFPTSAQRKSKIWLGKVAHPNLTTLSVTVNEPDYITSPQSFARDLFQALGPYINEGVIPYANGANLTINVTTGNISGNGINFVINDIIPNQILVSGASITFLTRTQTGVGSGSFISIVDVGNYDVGGVITAIPGANARSTNRYIYYVPSLGFIIQYGQEWYSNLSTAISAIGRESRIIYSTLPGNSILIGVLAARKDATQLNDINQAQFFSANKLGDIGGSTSGISTGTRQSTYNNSPTPQTVVTDVLGADTWRNGRALNTSTIMQWQNIAGITTASIDGNGLIKSGSTVLNDNIPIANNDLTRKDYVDSKLDELYVNNDYIAQNPPSSLTSILYESFPLIVRSQSNKMFLFYRQGADHATSKGVIQMRTSTDGGGAWASATTIVSDAVYDCRNVSGGITPTGRIILFYMRYAYGSSLSFDQGYIYSDNEGATWSTYTTIPNGTHTFYSPYGNLISIGDGKIMANWYGETPATPTYSSYVITSSDNGVSWSAATAVATSTSIRYGEASYAYLDGGVILGMIRNSVGSPLYQVLSTNNGASWTNQGQVTFDSGTQVSPWLTTHIDSNNEKYVSVFYANRSDNKLRISSADYATAVTGTVNWSLRIDLASHTITDFGYPTLIKSRENNKFLLGFYKASSTSLAEINFINYTPTYNSISVTGSITSSGAISTSSNISATIGSLNGKEINATNFFTIKGNQTSFPTVGSGFELYNQTGVSIFQSYDRTGAVYNQLSFRGSFQTWNIGATEAIRLHASRGISIGNTIDYGTSNLGIVGNIGAGITITPTAKVHIAASTTLAAAMRLTPGSAPTTPNDGDIWLQSPGTNLTDLKIRINGVTRSFNLT